MAASTSGRAPRCGRPSLTRQSPVHISSNFFGAPSLALHGVLQARRPRTARLLAALNFEDETFVLSNGIVDYYAVSFG